MTAVEMVGREVERRVVGRRAYDQPASAPSARGNFSSTHERARVELLLVEQQAASEHVVTAISHAAAALQTLTNELRAARAAAVASNRAGHLAAGAVSGATP